jgi:TRAP-type C4-dicarboxylate transport system substrate-binding protein
MLRFICLIALFIAPPAFAKTKVKMATMAPKGSVYHRIMKEMGEAWKAASNGEVRLKLYAGGVAGSDANVVDKMRLKTLHAGLLTSGGVSSIDTAIHALQLPMAYDSFRELEFVLEKLRPDLDAAYEAKGFIALDYIYGGWVRFFAKEQGCTPDDLAKRKLFVFAGSPVEKLWKDAGFSPVPLPSTEISTALQSGLITALPTTPQAAMLMQWQKHAPYMCSPKWAPLTGALLIKKETWDSFDAGLQAKLRAAARDAGKKLRDNAMPAEKTSIKEMAARGLNVIEVDKAGVKVWKDRLQQAYGKMRDTYAPGALIDKAFAARAEFRKLGGLMDGKDQ